MRPLEFRDLFDELLQAQHERSDIPGAHLAHMAFTTAIAVELVSDEVSKRHKGFERVALCYDLGNGLALRKLFVRDGVYDLVNGRLLVCH